MGIIYTSFLLRNLLCKNNYTMFTMFTLTKCLRLSYFVFTFLTYEVSYSKKY